MCACVQADAVENRWYCGDPFLWIEIIFDTSEHNSEIEDLHEC